MEFLSSNLPLILFFLAGFGLLLAEAFMPGIGIAGFRVADGQQPHLSVFSGFAD